ncbi:MAG: GAF domain-containing protein [Gammaproteobacteria bacterium]
MELAPDTKALTTLVSVVCDTKLANGGFLQLAGSDTQDLSVAAHCGLSDSFLAHFEGARTGDGTPCSHALAERRRVVIRDLRTDAAFRPHLEVSLAENVLAAQATPLIDTLGRVVGVFSSFYSEPHHPTRDELNILDCCCEIAIGIIESNDSADALWADYGDDVRRSTVSEHVVRASKATRTLLDTLGENHQWPMLLATRRNLEIVTTYLDERLARLN